MSATQRNRSGEFADLPPTPSSTSEFAELIEASSLGSPEAWQARLDGARLLADYPRVTPWARDAPAWPNIVTLNQEVMHTFQAENRLDRAELWLRAALLRLVDGPMAVQLAVMLESHRALDEAVRWYLRAAQRDHFGAAARLAVLAFGGQERPVAELLLAIGEQAMSRWQRMEARDIIACEKPAAWKRRIGQITDGDVLFWVGCERYIADRWDVAEACLTAANGLGHRLSTTVLFELTKPESARATIDDRDYEQFLSSFERNLRTAAADEVVVPLSRKKAEIVGFHDMVGGGDDSQLLDSLVTAAVAGDGCARDELLALIHPLVLKYCRARLGRHESLMGSADDVAQDVCMAVVSALPNYQLNGLSFRAFVYGIAAHKVTDAFRAIGRNRAEPAAELPDGPVTADGPEHRLLAAEMSARLGKLLGHLTPRQREVLVLRLAVGLSAEETAQAIRSTPGAVRVTQHRALGRLRKVLMGQSGVRGLAAAKRLEGESTQVAMDDSHPDDVDLDPGVAATDESTLDAIAAAFFSGAEPGQDDR
jgi:RNA polymerase sigma-70 factor (ECF subfamily)